MNKNSNFSKLTKQFDYINKNWDKVSIKIDNIINGWVNKLPEIKKLLKEKIYSGFVKRLNNIKENPRVFL